LAGKGEEYAMAGDGLRRLGEDWLIPVGTALCWIVLGIGFTIYDSRNWIPKSFEPSILLLRVGAVMATVVLLFAFFMAWRERLESFLLPDWERSLSSALLMAFGGYVTLMSSVFEVTPATRALGLLSLTVGAIGFSWFMSAAVTKVAAFLRYLRPPPGVDLLGAAGLWALGAPVVALAEWALGWRYTLRPAPQMPDSIAHLVLVLMLSVPTIKLASLFPRMRGPSRWFVSSMLGGYLAGLTAAFVALADDLVCLPTLLTDLWVNGSVVAAGTFALPPLLYFSGSTSLISAGSPAPERLEGSGIYLGLASPGSRYVERLYLRLKVGLDDGRRRGSPLDLFEPLLNEAELVIHLSTVEETRDYWDPGKPPMKVSAEIRHVGRAIRGLAEVRGAVVVLDSLTDLVAINGHEAVVDMLSSVRSRLTSSGVILLATIFPEAHEESELFEFEALSTELLDLRVPAAPSKPRREIAPAQET